MAVPDKYKTMGDFCTYYQGTWKAPYPTIFIGGNHEASNYLWELYHGGWVAENIFYLGHAGVINFNGIRIGGISGIHNPHHYHNGHYEKIPYDHKDVRSAYHVRHYDVNKLLQVRQPLDIFLSHDWPRGVERFGDLNSLLRFKKYFYKEVMTNSLGSIANEDLLTQLKPDYWFAAHLHVKFPATFSHYAWKNKIYPPEVLNILGLPPNGQQYTQDAGNPDEIHINDDEIQISDDDDNNNVNEKDNDTTTMNEQQNLNQQVPSSTTSGETQQQNDDKVTRFLSLDKCLPQRQFLQIVDIPSKNEDGFTYDLEWLAITRAMHPYLSLQRQSIPMPAEEELQQAIKQEEMHLEMLLDSDDLNMTLPHNFEPTAEADTPGFNNDDIRRNLVPFLNPQTTSFCDLIGIENKINVHGQQPIQRSSPSSSSLPHQQCQPSDAIQGLQVPEPSTTPHDEQIEEPHDELPETMESPSKKARLDEQ
ncbi:unnamed protein product [Absidia cylindrospora]